MNMQKIDCRNGLTKEQVAERVDMSVDGVKKISRKVNSKIARVTH